MKKEKVHNKLTDRNIVIKIIENINKMKINKKRVIYGTKQN